MIKKLLKSLAVGIALLSGSTAYAGPGADNWNGRTLQDGLVITLCGSNGRFLSSENGTRTMRCNRTSVGACERFTVEVVTQSPLRFRLIASNGRYLRVQTNSRMRATATSTADAVLFTSNPNVNNAGQHTLDDNGTFLSSENGTQAVRVNRNSVGAWERWDVGAQ